MNQKLRTAIPYIILVIGILMVVLATVQTYKLVNRCNTHLKHEFEGFIDKSCQICMTKTPLKNDSMTFYEEFVYESS